MNLSAEQRAAARASGEARVGVVAGAGSGKTRVLASRVNHLLMLGADPRRMMVCTFTRKAAAELEERISSRNVPYIGTIHSWCARILRDLSPLIDRTASFTVYDENDSLAILRDIARDRGSHTDARRSTLVQDEVLMATYGRRLLACDAVDFDQLVPLALATLRNHRTDARVAEAYRFDDLFVDECQDLDPLQWELFREIAPVHMFAVGDPRQSIYAFRGAAPELFEAYLTAEGTKRYDLATNYRSTTPVVDLANHVAGDWPPLFSARADPGVATSVRAPEEVAAIVSLIRDIGAAGTAVLTRTWRVAAEIRTALQAAGIRCHYYGSNQDPWESDGGRVLSWYLRLQLNPADDNLAGLVGRRLQPDVDMPALRARAATERRLLSDVLVEARVLPRAIGGHRSGEHARNLAAHAVRAGADWGRRFEWCMERLDSPTRQHLKSFQWWWSFGRAAQDRMEFVDGERGVDIMTVHAAKGLEWPRVILPRVEDGVYPHFSADDPDEDRRVLYVAITRARDAVYLVRSTARAASPFIGFSADDPDEAK